jgi:molybdopterin synthase catalytic subunit
MKVIAVVGTKKTGKTTLVTALVKSLAKYGRVGTIKNMAHHPVDRGDTKRHFDAGADEVMGLGYARLKVTRDRGNLESSLAELEKDGMDYVVVEGFKQSRLPKIVMADIDVPNTLRKVKVSEINDDLISDLTELILGLEDYRLEFRTSNTKLTLNSIIHRILH